MVLRATKCRTFCGGLDSQLQNERSVLESDPNRHRVGAFVVFGLAVYVIYVIREAQSAADAFRRYGCGMFSISIGMIIANRRLHRAAADRPLQMRRHLPILVLIVTVVFTSRFGWAQNANSDSLGSRFEVASVKRSYLSDVVQQPRITFAPGRYTATNVTLRAIVKHAFDVIVDAQLTGGPSWVDEARFNIDATAPGVAVEEMRPMVKRLLTDRFGLAVRPQTRTLPIYRLLRVRNDVELPKGLTSVSCAQSDRAGCGLIGGGPNSIMGRAITMGRFAKALTQMGPFTDIDRIVVDETGLTGTYGFSMDFAATREHVGLRVDKDPNLPSFTTALQEQLGLKLQAASAPVEVWIIKFAKLPDEN